MNNDTPLHPHPILAQSILAMTLALILLASLVKLVAR